MSSIYGTTREYTSDIMKRKRLQLRFRQELDSGDEVNLLAANELLKYSVPRMKIADLVVTFDGSIYNRQQLKDKHFRELAHEKLSDDRLLGLLYAKFGEACLHELNGDFAFVICDTAKRMLFGAVDRMGVKPLFYHHGTEGFEWCSQLLPLCIGNHYEIDTYARQCYFAMQYVPAPYSMVKQICKLAAGEYFTYNMDTGNLEVKQYWDLYFNSCGFDTPKNYEEAFDICRSLINDAVKLRVVPEETNGLFLSGGIDSSTIAKFTVTNGGRVEGFSVGFEENDYDESEYARKVAERYGIIFNRLICKTQEAIDVIVGLQQFYDEPMGDYSSIPTSLLCEKTGASVKIALGGDGGDEMFFGYPRYLRYAGYSRVFKIPMALRRMSALVARVVGKKRLADSLLVKDVQQLYMNRRPSNSSERFDAFWTQQNIPQVKYLYDKKDVKRLFNDFDIKTLMCYAYNVKVDRAAVRGHIDVRTPMLDYRIVEYSRLLPLDFCYNKDFGQKRILRDILYEDFDRSLFERKKQGFGAPLGLWFRGGLKEYLCDTLNEITVNNLPDYDGKALIKIRDRHIANEEDQTTLLWLCVNYLGWSKLFKECCK